MTNLNRSFLITIKSNLFEKLLCLLFIIIYSLPTDAQERFRGKIFKERNGKAAVGVKLQVVGTGDITYTDIKGVFIIYGIEQDYVKVSVIDRRFEPLEFTVYAYEDATEFVQKRDVSWKQEQRLERRRQRVNKQIPVATPPESEDPLVQFVVPNQHDLSTPSNAALLLQNTVPGLTVTRPGSDPNSPFLLYNRGISSVSQRNTPLILIDGIPEMSLERIDPEDIASIAVMKSGVSTAKYGIMGGAGVIDIQTLEYDSSRSILRYHSSVGAAYTQRNLKAMDAEEYAKYKPFDRGNDTDWVDEITQVGYSHRHHLSFSNGNGHHGFYASLGYQNENGILKKSGFEKGNARFTYQWNGKDGQSIIKLSAAITQKDSRLSRPDAFRQALTFNPTMPVFDANGDYTFIGQNTQNRVLNPVGYLMDETNLARTRDWTLNLRKTKYKSSERKIESQLSYRQRSHFFGFERRLSQNNSPLSRSDFGRKQFFGRRQGTHQFDWKQLKVTRVMGIESTLMFDKNIFFTARPTDEEIFNFHSIEEPASRWENTYEEGDLKELKIALSTWAGTTVDWNIWRFDMGVRYDRVYFDNFHASKFFYFARVDADFTTLINIDWLNQTHLSLGYGKTGSLTNPSFISNSQIQNIFAGEFLLPREDETGITNETKTEINLQLSLSLFDNLLRGVFNFYDNFLYNQVLIPDELTNGEFGNRGMEAYLEYKIVNKKKLNWRAGLSFFTNKSLTYRFNDEIEPMELSNLDRRLDDYNEMWLEPYGLAGQIYGHLTDKELLNGSYIPADAIENVTFKFHVIGHSKPSYGLSFTNNFGVGKWDLSVKFRSIIGHDIYNYFRETDEIINSTQNNIIKTRYFNEKRTEKSFGDYDVFVENASFLKMDFLSVGFTSALKNGQLRIYIAGHDLLTITGYTGIDPEPRYQYRGNALSGGFEYNEPHFRSKQFVVGAQLTL